ncbi:MAG TPA: hypothetical protein VIJ27_04820 [Mucilaginibacter sp.]
MSTAAPSFKKLLTEYIQGHIDEQKALQISWNCPYCHGSHAGNLFKKVRSMEMASAADSHAVEVNLMDETGQLFAAIKISKNKTRLPMLWINTGSRM